MVSSPLWHQMCHQSTTSLGTPIQPTLGPIGRACLQDLGPLSLWQQGPDLLHLPFKDWPTTGPDSIGEALPTQEMEAYPHVTVSAICQPGPWRLSTVLSNAFQDDSKLNNCLKTLVDAALCREKLELSVRVLARVLTAVILHDRGACSHPPKPGMIEIAVQTMIQASSRTAEQAMDKGKLQRTWGLSRRTVSCGSLLVSEARRWLKCWASPIYLSWVPGHWQSPS